MKLRSIFFICLFSLCSMLSWGQILTALDNSPVQSFFIEMKTFVSQVIGEKLIGWSILILSFTLFIMRVVVKEKGVTRKGATYIASNTLFLSACLLEIIHFLFVEDSIWFCVPDKVGWWWTIINFFILGGIVYNQILYLFDVITDVFTNGNIVCDIRLGLYSWIGGIIAAFLCSFFYKAGVLWVLLVVAIMQIVQSILIFRSYKSNWKGAFFASFVYLLGTFGTVVVTMTLLAILILVILAVLLLWLILKLTGHADGSGRRGKITVHFPNGSSEEAEEDGRGVLGEKYYKGKESGRTYID